ncbi:Membrane-associated, eicosanoid/glutathione metabolism (MAPEG) protein [Lasallia pustulata]|uniref:Membrane-associated, eicosanoid/glutathione metabolism (MAPEG) protein n=1 Tax=Lasallia pustulata TaxID=136370 RepID=A0A1W5DD52_9LECA|nr:Membrane-associated, eicosanoid/glutathione metabolism (MAPEG) protein [Lasallia pustulata]
MASFFDGSHNWSLHTIPAAWVLAVLPHSYAMYLAGPKVDNTQPRGLLNKLASDQSVDSATKARIARAEGAQANGFENIGLYAAAIVAGNIAGLDTVTLNYLGGGYLLSRMAYNMIYIHNQTATTGYMRSGAFFTSICIIMTLFVKAGNKLQPGLL